MSSLDAPAPEPAQRSTTSPAVTSERGASETNEIIQERRSYWARLRNWTEDNKWGYGVFLVGVVVVLWNASNFAASDLLSDNTYSKPFFVTYINSSFFTICLPIWALFKRKAEPGKHQTWRRRIPDLFRGRYTALKQDELEGSIYHDSPTTSARRSISPFPPVALGDSMGESQEVPPAASKSEPLSVKETFNLALGFAPLWCLANYFVTASLENTAVATSTLLTSTSAIWTLLIGTAMGVEKFTMTKFVGILVCFGGIVITYGSDLFGGNTDDDHRGDFPDKTLGEQVVGGGLALASAVMYGIYASTMKKRVPDEGRLDTVLFFGFVGSINILVMLPGFLVLDFSGLETFRFPTAWLIWKGILLNSGFSLVADMCWAKAVVLTSPVLVTIGVSLTIPVSMIWQWFENDQVPTVLYALGATVVMGAVFWVAYLENYDEHEKQGADSHAQEHRSRP